jgi:hypothetical protein
MLLRRHINIGFAKSVFFNSLLEHNGLPDHLKRHIVLEGFPLFLLLPADREVRKQKNNIV